MDKQSQNHNFPDRSSITNLTDLPEIGGKESQKGKTEQYHCKYQIDAFQTRIMNATNTCNTMHRTLQCHTAPQYMLVK